MLPIEAIKKTVTMRQVCEVYGIKVDRIGNAVCPFHADHSPSMKVYPGAGGWYCFACAAGGDVIDFVRQFYGLSLYDACKKLNDDFRLGLPIGKEFSLRDHRDMEQAIRERVRARKAAKVVREELVKDYWLSFDRLAALDCMVCALRPESWDEITEDAARAIRLLPGALDALADAELRLWDYDHPGE